MIELLAVGVGACFVGSGALTVAAVQCGPRMAGTGRARAARLHVSAVEEVPVSQETGPLEVLSLYGADTAAMGVTYTYCPREFRVTPHVERDAGGLCCWDCPEGEQ
ncbi:hypothetical protein [Streptomyces sp. AMCC400023]|uniref:hypothetical protein n=1 Tax=Streptomyces sp. AMCC400023 TaxID=2056258 RepID=UPI001F415269|nr:hypothetical protein [Streptomyces sp. AMCC400023]UJV42912.1 hypothetical protein CVT30_26495 [Streptomyces sp. AMCC400023]